MQKAILQKPAWMIIFVLLFVICFCFLSKAGIQPLWAAIGVVFLKGLVRFIFRMTLMLVSIAIVISSFISAICIWL